MSYSELVSRNLGYVSSELQDKIKNTSVLIAGCGVGSFLSEAALRMGFTKITLVDGDTINRHNLNRQDYVDSDIGKKKVSALKNRLISIFPTAEITALDRYIKRDDVEEIISSHDLIIDTIDFLDLPGIISLHDAALKQKIPVISAFSAGWGAAAIFLPNAFEDVAPLRRLFGLSDTGYDFSSYKNVFSEFFSTLYQSFPSEVVQVLNDTFRKMEEGKPCPAPSLSVGSFSVAALVLTLMVRVLSGQKVSEVPYLLVTDFGEIAQSRHLDLTTFEKRKAG